MSGTRGVCAVTIISDATIISDDKWVTLVCYKRGAQLVILGLFVRGQIILWNPVAPWFVCPLICSTTDCYVPCGPWHQWWWWWWRRRWQWWWCLKLGEAGWGAGRNNMIMRPSVCCAQIGGRRPQASPCQDPHFFRATSNFQLLIIQIFDWNQRNDTFSNSNLHIPNRAASSSRFLWSEYFASF